MSKLRKAARGQPCYLRLPGCSHDPAQTVLAHIRRGNVAGIGQKPVDICGLPACESCHSKFDGRSPSPYSRTEMDADALRGLCQWLSYLHREGVLHA